MIQNFPWKASAFSTILYADFHTLRHTFITNMMKSGVNPKNVQAFARHSTIDLTMNVYTSLTVSDQAAVLAALDAVRVQIGKAIGQQGRDGWEPRLVLSERSLRRALHWFLGPVPGDVGPVSPNIHIKKVPSMVPQGARYGAIQLASKRFVLHQSAMNGHQIGHLGAAKNQTETPTGLGFPS